MLARGGLAFAVVLALPSCQQLFGLDPPVDRPPDGAAASGSDAARHDATAHDGVNVDADTGPTPTSCVSLAPTCGPTGTASCCTSPLVPGGTFYRSYDVAGDGLYGSNDAPATVSDFRLDTYVVTVGRFRRFVAAGSGTQANPPLVGAGARRLNGNDNQGGWDPAWNASLPQDNASLRSQLACDEPYAAWTDAPGANEALPMNCLTWFEAFAFCAWDGGFLPTEAEWNFAAAGGSDQRAYPWSSPAAFLGIDCSYADYEVDTQPAKYCVNSSAAVGGVNRVGSESPKGDGKYGHADLSGNVWQWNLDWYVPTYATPCDDCAALTTTPNTQSRVVRGGFFGNDGPSLRSSDRFLGITPSVSHEGVGVRCARMP